MTFINVLQSPSNTVPSLSDNDTYMVIVSSIKAYLDKKIALQTLVNIASKIKTFRGIHKAGNNIDFVLEKLSSLPKFLKGVENKKSAINGVLIGVLDSISSKKH